MQANFFATTEDWVTLWGWVMAIPGMRVVEHYSRPDLPNRNFRTIEEIEAAIRANDFSMAAWPSAVGGQPRVERIDFEPNTARKLGAKGRWAFRSPALITFMRHNEQKVGCLSPSYLSCWSEAGARQRSMLPEDFLNEVDWKAFDSVTRGLQRKMRANSDLALSAAPILPDAAQQLESGTLNLWGWGEVITASSTLIKRRP